MSVTLQLEFYLINSKLYWCILVIVLLYDLLEQKLEIIRFLWVVLSISLFNRQIQTHRLTDIQIT